MKWVKGSNGADFQLLNSHGDTKYSIVAILNSTVLHV